MIEFARFAQFSEYISFKVAQMTFSKELMKYLPGRGLKATGSSRSDPLRNH
jgi:hypothetical protein